MRFLFLLCLCVQAIFVRADVVELYRDDHIIHGKLENGLSYYVLSNPNPEEEACLRLMVKVGSVYEQDDEKGLAHFVEHMVYRGSRHFKDGEVMRFLESQGAWMGPDANAYTGFETTVYKVDLPHATQARLEKTVQIFSDLAFHAQLPDHLIQKERRVILDELRQSDGNPSSKARHAFYDMMIEGTPYADHYPAGHTQVVMEAPPEKIRQFYHRWYRPDRMAVIAIGDFDSEAVVEMIERHFGLQETPKEPVQAPDFQIEFLMDSQAMVYTNPHLSSTVVLLGRMVSLASHEKENPGSSIEGMKEGFTDTLYEELLEARLRGLSERYPGLFYEAWDASAQISDYLYLSGIGASCPEGKAKEALAVLTQELQRIQKWGFTQEELTPIKEKYLTVFANFLEFYEEPEHDEFVTACEEHFLGVSDFGSFTVEQDLLLEALSGVALEDINDLSIDFTGYQVFLQTPSEEVDANTLLSVFQTESEMAPHIQSPVRDFAFGGVSGSGFIKEELIGDDFYHWGLSNGATVIFKPTGLKKNEVVLCATAQGGYDLFSPRELPSARLALPYFEESGLGNLSMRELEIFLSRRQLYIDFNTERTSRSVTFFALPTDLEIAFQLIHTGFTAPRFDNRLWSSLQLAVAEGMERRRNNPKTAFADFIQEINFQEHPLFQMMRVEDAREEGAKSCFQRMFGYPDEFTFVLVGALDVEEARRYVENYIASIPLPEERSPAFAHSLHSFPEAVITKRFRKGVMSGATTVITLPLNFEECLSQVGYGTVIEGVLMVLERRLEAVLRERDGDTYGVSVRSKYPYYPQLRTAFVEIFFTSEEVDIDRMSATIFQEIERLKIDPPSLSEAATVRELMRTLLKEGKESNWSWASAILNTIQYGRSLDSIFENEEKIVCINPDSLKRGVDCVFSSPYRTILSHVPEETLALK